MSDILSRLAERAQGSPVCLVHRVRYRFAPPDAHSEGWSEAGGDALAGPLETAAGNNLPTPPRALDQGAASGSRMQLEAGHRAPGSSGPTPEPSRSTAVTEPPVASEARFSRGANAPTPGRAKLSAGPMSPPAIHGGAAAPPSLAQTALSPVAQRVAKSAMSRETAASAVDSEKATPVAARVSGRPDAQRESRSAVLSGGRDRASVNAAEIGAEGRTTPAAIGGSNLVPAETSGHKEKSKAAKPMRLPAGTSPRTMPLAATPGGNMKPPVAQLRADPALARTAKAATVRSGPADHVGEVPPTPAARSAMAAERPHRSPIERTDRLPAPQWVGPQPATLEESVPPTPESGAVKISSPGRRAARDQTADRTASLTGGTEDPRPAGPLAAPWLPPSSERMVRTSSSEVETGSRRENASNQQSGAPFRFNGNGKGSSRAAPSSRLAALRPTAESHTPTAHSISDPHRWRATESSPAPAPATPEIHIDIGRIQIELPRAPVQQAQRRRPEPPPLQGKPRGGPEG